MASKFTITAELNLQTKNLSQVVNNLKQQFQGADFNIKIKDLAKAEASLRNISSGAKDASASMGMLGGSINQAFRRFTVVTLATGTIVGFTRALKNAVGDAIEFERELVKIAQATGQTVSQLKGLATEVGNVSSSFGVSSKELILAARSLTQAGFAADKVTGSLKVLAQTELAATFDSIANTTEGAIAILNQFGKQAQKTGSEVAFLEKSFSAINQVSKEFAVESSDLVTAVRTTGAAFESAGGSLNELLALFTSVRSTTRESAESISTGFRTIFTRVQRVDTINNLKALGIQLQDVEGKFVGPLEATKRLSMALSTIDPRDFRFNLIVEELGGFRQVSKVIPLIQQFATTQKALNVAQGSSGSLAKDAQTAQLSLAVQISKTREEFLRFIRDLTATEAFQGTVRTLLNMANAFIKVADTIKPLVPLLASFAALRIGQSIIPAIASVAGGRNKKAEGGIIHKFASGGLVPGQGNSDTVPAMLTPGEFVIKKSSVQKLGVNNLAQANKYANGGKVQYYGTQTGAGRVKENDISKQYAGDISSFSIATPAKAGSAKQELQKRQSMAAKMSGRREYGGAFLRPVGEDTQYTGYVTKAEVLKKAKIKSGSSKAKNLEQDKYPFTIKLASVNKDTREIFQSSILDGIANVVDQTSRKVFASSMSTGAVPKDISYKTLKKSNIDQTVGNIFEASLKSLSGKFTNDDKAGAGNQTFDFPSGLGDASKYFDPELANVKTDAKASYTLQSLQSLVEKVKADVKEQYIPKTQKEIQKVEKSQTGLRVNVGPDKALVGSLQEMAFEKYKKNPDKIIPGTAGWKGITKSNKLNSGVTQLINKALESEKWNELSFADADKKSQFLREVLGFANGGMASGSDTVPAMLTPGEYVINKKSAQAIGYNSLNRMNKVGKFAEGGPVQFLNPGGSVTTDQFSAFRPKTAPVENQAEVVEKVTNKFGDLSDQLLLFGPAITGVISQMGMFDKATADLISATTLTFSTIQGVGGNLTQQAGKMFGLDETDKRFKMLNLGVTAYAASQAAAAYRVQSFGNVVETEGKKFASFVESLTNGPGTSQSQMTEALNEQFKAASQVQSRQSGVVKAAGAIGTIGGTLLGGAAGASSTLGIGAAPGAIAGGAAGGAIAEEIAAYAVYGMSLKKVTEQANALSSAMYSATESNREFQKFNQNIDKQSPEKIAEQSAKLSAAYKLQSDELAKFNPKDLASASDAVKQQFQAVADAAKLTAKNLQQVIGAQLQQAAKRSGNLIGLGYEPDIEKLLVPVFESIRSKVESQYADQMNNARTDQERTGIGNQRNKQIQLEQEEARKTLVEATKQQLEMTAALTLENNIRKELIGNMQKQLAMSAAIERTAYELDRVSKTVSQIDAVFSGSLTGLKSSYDPEVLKMKSPDESRLNDALAPVRAMGSAGQDLANNIVNINKVMPNLEAKLLEFEKATQTTADGVFDAAGFVKNAFDIDVNSLVGKALVGIVKNTTTGNAQGTNAVTAASTQLSQPEVRRKIAETFEKFGEEFRTQASGILENLAKAEQEGRVIAEKINESRQKQLELALQGIDTFSQYIDAVSKARGRDLSLMEKNNIRNMRQFTLAGPMGNNSAALGMRLNKIYSDLNKGGLSIDESAKLNAQARNLTKALEGLANQSDKTADVLQEIDKIRKNRENLRELGREFGTGTAEDKAKMQQDMQAAMTVAMTGSYDSIPEEMRKGADAMLERFKDIPFFKQAQNRAIADTFMQAGNPLAAQMVMQESSAPEEMLIRELDTIFARQIAAQQRLSMVEGLRQSFLIKAQQDNTKAIENMSGLFEKLTEKFQNQANLKPVENAGMPEEAKGKLDPENIAALNKTVQSYTDNIIQIDDSVTKIAVELKVLGEVLKNNNDIFTQDKIKIDRATQPLPLDKWNQPVNPQLQNDENRKQLKKEGFSEERIDKILQMLEEKRQAANPNPNIGDYIDDLERVYSNFIPKNKSQGGVIYRADGGSIFQPKGTDTVPAMLTPGEFVIKKSSVDKIGVGTLSKINAGHYAVGGMVSGIEPFLQETDDYNRSKLEKQGSGIGLYSNKDKGLRWDSLTNAGINRRGQFALDNMNNPNYDAEKGNDGTLTVAFNKSGIVKQNETTLDSHEYKNGGAGKSGLEMAEEIRKILDEDKDSLSAKDSKKEKEIKKDVRSLKKENIDLKKQVVTLDKSVSSLMSDIEQVLKGFERMAMGVGGMGNMGGISGFDGGMGGFGNMNGGGAAGGLASKFAMLSGVGMGMMGGGRTSNRRARSQRRLATIKKVQEKAMPAMIQRQETEAKDKAQKAGQLETRGPASWNNPDQFDNNGVPLFNKTPLEPIELKSARDEAKGTGSPDFVGPPTKSEAFQAKLKADNAAYDKRTEERRAKAQVMIDAQTKKDEERAKLGRQKVEEARVAANKTAAQRAADRSQVQKSTQTAMATTKPKQSPYFFTSKATKVRPANSMYTQEQWDEMLRTGSNKPSPVKPKAKPKGEAYPIGPMITRGVMAGKYPYSDGTYRTQPDQPTYQSPEQEMGNRAYNAPDPKKMSTAAYIKALEDRRRADIARGGGPTISNMLREGQERREAQRREALDPNNEVATSLREGEAKRKKQRQEARSLDSDAAKMIAEGLKRQEENRKSAMQDAAASTGPQSQINKLVQAQKNANSNYSKPLPEQKTQTDRLVKEQQDANSNYGKPVPERPSQQALLGLSLKQKVEKLKKEQEESNRIASLREPLVPRIPSRVDKNGKPLPKPYTPPMVEPVTPPISPLAPKAPKATQDQLLKYMTGQPTPSNGQTPLPEFARPAATIPTLPKKKAIPKPFAWPGMERDPNVPRNKPTSGWPDMRRDENVPRVKPSALYPDLAKDPNVAFPKPLQYIPGPGQSVQEAEQAGQLMEQRKALEAKIEAKKKEIYEAQGGAMGSVANTGSQIGLLDELNALEKQKADLMGGSDADKAWRNRKNLYGDPDKSIPFPKPIPTMARPLPGETLPESMDRYNRKTQRDAIGKQIYGMTGGAKGNKDQYVSPEEDMQTKALLEQYKNLTEPNFRSNGGIIYRADGGLADFRSNIKKNMNVRQQLQQNRNTSSNPNKSSNIFTTGATTAINTAKFATGVGLSDADKLVKAAANKGELQNQQNATGFAENSLEFIRGAGAAGGDAIMGLPEAAAGIADRAVRNTVGGNLGASDVVGSVKDTLFVNGDSLKSNASQYGKLTGDIAIGALTSLTGQPPSEKLLSFIKSKGSDLLTGAAGTILKESADFNALDPSAQFAILTALGKAGNKKSLNPAQLNIPDKAKEFVQSAGSIEKLDKFGQFAENKLRNAEDKEKKSILGSVANIGFNKGGLVSYFANGGMPKGTDTVPAMLTPGEFVMKKSAVDKHGQDFMEALNAGGEVKGFARGGLASGMFKNAIVNARNKYGRGPLSDVTDKAFGLTPKPATREPAPDLSNANNLLPKELQAPPATPPVDIDVSKTPKKRTFEDTIRTTNANRRARREANPEFGMNTAQIRNKQLSDPMAQQRMALAARGRAAYSNTPQGMQMQQAMNNARGQIQGAIGNTMGQMQGAMGNTYAQMGTGNNTGANKNGIAQQSSGMPDMTGISEILNNMSTAFTGFTDKLNSIATAFNGLTVTHNVIFGGQVNVGGIDGPKLVEAVRTFVDDKIRIAIAGINGTKGANALGNTVAKPPDSQ